MKTFSAKAETVKRDWYLVDATNKVLGRLRQDAINEQRQLRAFEPGPPAVWHFVANAGLNAVTDLRNRLYEHILKQSFAFLGRRTTGSLMSHITTDVEKIQAAVSELAGDLLKEGLTILGLLAVYFAGARLAGRTPAFIAAVLLGINVAEVWYARYPNSEVMQQALLFAREGRRAGAR